MQKAIDALKLSSQDWSKLQQSLSKRHRLPTANIRDGGIRVGLGEGILALLRIANGGHHNPHFHIRCRNISSGGLGFVHGQFIHTGTPVQIIFVMPNRQGVIADGIVVRANLIDKNIHEIGVKFDEVLDMDEIFNLGLAVPPTEVELEASSRVKQKATTKSDDANTATAANTANEAVGESTTKTPVDEAPIDKQTSTPDQTPQKPSSDDSQADAA